VSYSSPNLLPYAAYAYAVTAAYAEHHHYSLALFSQATNSNYEPRDQRWNRVKILLEALDPHTGSHRAYQYLVWVDADLVFIDFSFSFEALIAAHPDADVIISAERHAETGVANTGCFIVKNTPWSINFLSAWWNRFDRSQAHDQIYFDVLYKSLLLEQQQQQKQERFDAIDDTDLKKHIVILPPTALNSLPPAVELQQEKDAVLHLMGESTSLRQRAFKEAFVEVCRAWSRYEDEEEEEEGKEENKGKETSSSSSLLKPQLGLTQPVLLHMALQTTGDSLDASLQDVSARTRTRKGGVGGDEEKVILDLVSDAREAAIRARNLLVAESTLSSSSSFSPTTATERRAVVARVSTLLSRQAEATAATAKEEEEDMGREGEESTYASTKGWGEGVWRVLFDVTIDVLKHLQTDDKGKDVVEAKLLALNLCAVLGQDLAQQQFAVMQYLHANARAHTHIHESPSTLPELQVLMSVHRHTHTHIDSCLQDLTRMVSFLCMQKHTQIYITHTCIHIRLDLYVYTYTLTCAGIHIYIHAG